MSVFRPHPRIEKGTNPRKVFDRYEERGKISFRCPQRIVANIAGVRQSTVSCAVQRGEVKEDLLSIVRFVLKHQLKCPVTVESIDELVDSWGVVEEEDEKVRKKRKIWGKKVWGLRKK